MSNKTQLATNNTQLASLIQTLQGKAAGGGGAVETCTVAWTDLGYGCFLFYVKPDLTSGCLVEWDFREKTVTFDVVKDSTVVVVLADSTYYEYRNAEEVSMVSNDSIGYHCTIKITGDATVIG